MTICSNCKKDVTPRARASFGGDHFTTCPMCRKPICGICGKNECNWGAGSCNQCYSDRERRKAKRAQGIASAVRAAAWAAEGFLEGSVTREELHASVVLWRQRENEA